MPRQNKSKSSQRPPRDAANDRDTEVRIIGGEFRGRRLNYHGDPLVRPMKHRTREAIFNLVNTECKGKHAIDLFAGTGALGLEALSRGAAHATLIEKHVPTARVIEENIKILGVENRSTVAITSAFLWAKRDLPEMAAAISPGDSWLVFYSPPYAFYHDRQAEMLDLFARLRSHAPNHSIIVVEADDQFDLNLLRADDPSADAWDIRTYAPAVVGLYRKIELNTN